MSALPYESYEPLDPLAKLAREIRAAGSMLDRDQARFLVSLFYQLQEHRIALGSQTRSLMAADKPTDVVDHFFGQIATLEKQMVSVLDKWTESSVIGRWSRSVRGIGPILAAAVLAHVDIERAPTVGHIWRFAGLDPTLKWGKGQKRPWNGELKLVCWKIGESFCKASGHQEAFYGKVYRERKAVEVERNEAGAFADQAAETLRIRKFTDKTTKAIYEAGKLPPGRLDLRARRYAVKLYLSHWHYVAYKERYDEEPPKPYILTQEGGHAHFIPPPNYPWPS